MAIHIGEYVRDRADILAWLRHHRSDGLTNIGGIDATYRERLLVTLAPNAAFITRTGVHRRPAQRVGEKNAAVLDYVLMPSTSLSFKGPVFWFSERSRASQKIERFDTFDELTRVLLGQINKELRSSAIGRSAKW
jgi:hypothetical protein